MNKVYLQADDGLCAEFSSFNLVLVATVLGIRYALIHVCDQIAWYEPKSNSITPQFPFQPTMADAIRQMDAYANEKMVEAKWSVKTNIEDDPLEVPASIEFHEEMKQVSVYV